MLAMVDLSHGANALNAPAPDLVISEFMAANNGTLRDEDGDLSDWIEIQNAGNVPAGLDGWFLTDNAGNLKKWRFPATNLAANAYLVVFASEKDRRTPGAPLHTNFRLATGGEYLALVRPDGVTVASQFTPSYPPQVPDVSYGFATVSAPTTAVTTGTTARLLVPADGGLGTMWTLPLFDDSAWTPVTNGVGFMAGPAFPSLTGSYSSDVATLMHRVNSSAYARIPFVLSDPGNVDILTLRMKYDDGFVAYLNGTEVARRNAPARVTVVADSVMDLSGEQGRNGWSYGYYNRSTDPNGAYDSTDFTPFPSAPGAAGPDNYWTGTAWHWFAGDPPWTEINANGGHPNGNNSGDVHWAIRRWTSSVDGNVNLRIRVAKVNTGCGSGVTGVVFRNGSELFRQTIAFNNGAGVTTNLFVPALAVGDTLDFALSPTGTDGVDSDSCDGSLYTIVVERVEDLVPDWDSTATAIRPNSQAIVFEDMDVSAALPGLTAGTNYLALQGLNITAADGDFLLTAELLSRRRTVDRDMPHYFSNPTPGADNGVGTETLGPIISGVSHLPAMPEDDQDLFVTARLTPTFAPIGSVSLTYRVMFGGETTLAMLDDGWHGDAAAGDGIYGARIPAADIAKPGQMVRWFLSAMDTSGLATRYPTFEDPINSPQYLGTIVDLPRTNLLPVLHWFIQNPAAADTDAGTKASIFYEGEFYDNVSFNIHGQSSRGFPKKSYDIDFNPGDNFRYAAGQARVDDINLLSTYPDKAHMRNMLSYETYRDAGSPYHFAFSVRVQQNGVFWGEMHFVENGDANYLERLGLDPNGALYKMYNDFQDAADTAIGVSAAEKKTRKNEGNADLVDLLAGLKLTGTARANWMFDNLDIPEVVNFLAAKVITADVDCCHKNYYFYRDTDGTGEWQMLPWDVDLSFGRTWNQANTYFDDTMFATNFYNNGDPLFIGGNNSLPAAIFNTPATRAMYLRRIRTLMDELLQPPHTSPYLLKYERRVDQLAAMIAPDAALDFAKWSTWGVPQTLPQAVQILKNQFLEPRRHVMYERYSVTNGGEIPLAQPAPAVITFGDVESNPSSRNQAEEYIQLLNTNNYAADLSFWRLSGGVDFTFQGGTVMAANSSLYVSPDVNAFRARATGPRGGQGLFVQGGYHGQLSARGEPLQLSDRQGRLVAATNTPANPSPAQQFLRITEIMYHPAPPPPGSPYTAEDFEFIELKNTGPASLDLTGVHFANGLAFNFTGATVTHLAAGQSLVLAKNSAAFTARYGSSHTIAGQYLGSLDNSGEHIRLLDAVNEEILDFGYHDSWYPVTDGLGFSLVVVDEGADPDAWDSRFNWRPSGAPTGSPEQDDPAPVAVAPVLVNEILANSDLPMLDSVELFNPTTNAVDMGGWFLSDDFNSPAKFRIPNGTLLAPGGFMVFDESAFRPASSPGTGFALSSDGDEIWLFSGDSAGTNLTGYFHGFGFGASAPGVSFGRHVNSAGAEQFVAQSNLTLGAANSGPLVGPVVISEIMYHPPDRPDGTDNQDDEFIELVNATAANVSFYDPARPTNTWRLRGGVDFDFPATNLTLNAGQYLLVAGFNPTNTDQLARFRARYGVPAEVAMFGPYDGKLDNSSDRVALYRPEVPTAGGVPYVLVDQVEYADDGFWPSQADGLGPSLRRSALTDYGDDPASWTTAAPSPGTAPANGQAPQIAQQPAPATSAITHSPMISVSASGAGPLQYQWRHDGAIVPGATNNILVLPNVQLDQAGSYDVVVFNPIGAVLSSNAVLNIEIPAFIHQQPVAQNVNVGMPITFAVGASSTSSVRYQWRFNGADLPGATNDTYSIAAAETSDSGIYDVVVTDAVSSIVSDPAELIVLVDPIIVVQPLGAAVPDGGSVALSVAVTNTATLPIGYRWRRGGITAEFTESDDYVNVFVVTNITAPVTVTVVVSNLARPFGLLSQRAELTVLADTDHDGLPDLWEQAHGFSSTDATDAAADFDGDGMTNGEEYMAGTDPKDPASYLKVERLGADGGTARIEFLAVSNRAYAVEFTDAIGILPWAPFAHIAAKPTNRMEAVLDPAPAFSRFYRLSVP